MDLSTPRLREQQAPIIEALLEFEDCNVGTGLSSTRPCHPGYFLARTTSSKWQEPVSPTMPCA